MESIDSLTLNTFVNENIEIFHGSKLRILKNLDLRKVLKSKNPYLFKAKNITVASDLVKDVLDAYLSSSEEKLFGDFLECLTIFVSQKAYNGKKSAAAGIDLEFFKDNVHYIVSIKSGPSWGNSSQQKKQELDFQTAVKVLKQSNHILNVQPVLGICYGKTRTSYIRGYLKVVGQNFWYLISSQKNFYKEIIEPLGYQAKHHNDLFYNHKAELINQLTMEFMSDFCTTNGQINWDKIVEFNSSNLDID